MRRYLQYQALANAPQIITVPLLITTYSFQSFDTPKPNWKAQEATSVASSPQLIIYGTSQFVDTPAARRQVDKSQFVFNAPSLITTPTTVISSSFTDAPQYKRVVDNNQSVFNNHRFELFKPVFTDNFKYTRLISIGDSMFYAPLILTTPIATTCTTQNLDFIPKNWQAQSATFVANSVQSVVKTSHHFIDAQIQRVRLDNGQYVFNAPQLIT